ncbi:MAG TPA: SPOR domain-containing protein [Gammaproteobacteria bacterium]|nr:SPOR domain-containing protein [Gammaproteobacteria bacterium]
MTRDYANYKRKKQQQSKLPLLSVLITAGIFVSYGAWYFYHQSNINVANLKNETVTKVSSIFPSIFHRNKLKMAAKKIITTTEVEKPLHFDFYDELPKTRLEAPVVPVADKEDKREKELPAIEPVTAAAAPATPAVKIAPVVEKSVEVEKPAVEAPPYILQVAIFHSVESANRYRNALASAGLKVDVVKAREGNEIVYRLQQGPYRNPDQLKLAKKKFMERGITCDVRRVTPYI